MPTRRRYQVVILDFDGVLVESADIKTEAYAALYKGYGPEVVEQVIAYDRLHGGLSRFAKFRYYHRELLKKELGRRDAMRLGRRFSHLVKDAVIAAAWVRGVPEFLADYSDLFELYIASGTPEAELRQIVAARGMASFFKGIYGSPRTKVKIIGDILSRSGYRPEEAVMVGDSLTDYQAAVCAGISFVGRVARGATGSLPASVATIHDFADQAAIRLALFEPQ